MGGNYDGDVGSISAIEVAQVLNEKHAALRHPLEIILFQNEEGGPIGSQALGEGLERNALAEPHSDEIGVEVLRPCWIIRRPPSSRNTLPQAEYRGG